MTIANGSRHSMAYVSEVTYGVTPATPAFKMIRHNGTTLALSKSTFTSAELRADRQVTDMRHGTRKVGGNITSEFSGAAFDDFLQASMGGAWVPSATTGSISLSATVGSFNQATGSFITDGFAVGQNIVSSGFATAGNNGRFVITAVSALALTVTPLDGQTMASDVAAAARTISSNAGVLKAGVTRQSFTIERDFADIGQYLRYSGVEFDGFDIDVKAEGIVPIVFNVIGKDQTSAAVIITGATYTAAPTNSPYDGFSGTIKEGGTTIAVLTEVKATLKNNLAPIYVVGSASTLEPSIGKSMLSGSITAYFQDTAMLSKFVNETESSIEFTLTDGTRSYDILIPRVKYTGAPPNVSSDKPITLAMPFTALLDGVTGTNIQITRAP
jgi:hypothetical protein